MLRGKRCNFDKKWWPWLLGIIFLWLALTLWPVKSLLWPGNWWGESLVVVLNENEARPCGGFATAYGVIHLPLISADVGNSYELAADLGPAPRPLNEVSSRLHFWDLGRSTDLAQCAEDFMAGYRANVDDVDRVLLLPMGFLENWSRLVGGNNFFTAISREVANIDRHDETSIATRKNQSAQLVKSLIRRTLVRPWAWPRITRQFQKKVFWSGKKATQSTPANITVTEWNLGGGKSSRYLRKQADIDLREISPGNWIAQIKLNIDHLGGYDEPLSQIWKGGFEVNVFEESRFIKAEISPGARWSRSITFRLKESPNKAKIHLPKWQRWQTNFAVSVIPGQALKSKHLKVQESVGRKKYHYSGPISWEIVPDTNPPFLTLHNPIDPNLLSAEVQDEINWSEGDLVTEIHFNEAVNLTGQNIQLEDRNFSVPEITENPQIKGAKLLDDQVTMLIAWSQNEYQKDERFYLTLSEVEDIWGNKIGSGKRTIITR